MSHPGERTFYREQDVTLVGPGGDRAGGRLAMWLEDTRAALTLDGPAGHLEARAGNFFDALIGLRRQLAPAGWSIAVQGARGDAYPSPTQRDGRYGLVLYLRVPGQQTRREDVVKLFDPAEPRLLATPDEQRAHFEAWLDSVPKE